MRVSSALFGMTMLIALSGCELLTSTPAPPFLTYVRSEASLDGLERPLPENIGKVDALPLTTGAGSFIALIVRGEFRSQSDNLLLIDDAFRVRLDKSDSFVGVRLNRSGLITSAEELLIGNLLYNPETNSASNRAAPEDESFLGVQVGGNYYVLSRAGENEIRWQEWDAASVLLNTERTIALSGDDPVRGGIFAHDFVDPDGNRFVAIVAGTGNGQLYVITVPVAAVPTLTGPLFSVTAPTTGTYVPTILPGRGASSTVLTRAGIISYEGGVFRRFHPTTGGELDRFEPVDEPEEFEERYVAAFFITGERYVILDKERKRLFEVAPWW